MKKQAFHPTAERNHGFWVVVQGKILLHQYGVLILCALCNWGGKSKKGGGSGHDRVRISRRWGGGNT